MNLDKPTHRSIALLAGLALATLGAGCGKKDDAPKGDAKVEETGKELSKNPFKAAQQLGEAAQKAGEAVQKASERKPVDPVKFDVLIPLLPKPEDWTAAEPEGSTTSMGEWKITVVSGRYSKPVPEGSSDPEPRVKVEITDGGFVPMVYAPFHMMSQFSTESTTGYQKGITIDGHPGFEKWEKASRSSELWVMVADRFIVHLDGDQVEPATLRDWLGQIDLKKLTELH